MAPYSPAVSPLLSEAHGCILLKNVHSQPLDLQITRNRLDASFHLMSQQGRLGPLTFCSLQPCAPQCSYSPYCIVQRDNSASCMCICQHVSSRNCDMVSSHRTFARYLFCCGCCVGRCWRCAHWCALECSSYYPSGRSAVRCVAA